MSGDVHRRCAWLIAQWPPRLRSGTSSSSPSPAPPMPAICIASSLLYSDPFMPEPCRCRIEWTCRMAPPTGAPTKACAGADEPAGRSCLHQGRPARGLYQNDLLHTCMLAIMRCMSSSCLSTTLKAGPGLRERGSGGAACRVEQVGRVTCVPFGLADTYEHAHAEGISNGGFVAHNKSQVREQGGTSTFLQASVSLRHSQLVTCSRPVSPCRQRASTSQPLSRRLTVQIARPVAAVCPTKGDLQPPSELRHATPAPAAARCMLQTLKHKYCGPQPTFHSSSPRSVSRSPSTSSAALAMVLHSVPHTPGPSCSNSVSLSPLSTCGAPPPGVSAASPSAHR